MLHHPCPAIHHRVQRPRHPSHPSLARRSHRQHGFRPPLELRREFLARAFSARRQPGCCAAWSPDWTGSPTATRSRSPTPPGQLGLSDRGGRSSPFVRAISRTIKFELAPGRPRRAGRAAQGAAPEPTPGGPLPPALQVAHRRWQEEQLQVPSGDLLAPAGPVAGAQHDRAGRRLESPSTACSHCAITRPWPTTRPRGHGSDIGPLWPPPAEDVTRSGVIAQAPLPTRPIVWHWPAPTSRPSPLVGDRTPWRQPFGLLADWIREPSAPECPNLRPWSTIRRFPPRRRAWSCRDGERRSSASARATGRPGGRAAPRLDGDRRPQLVPQLRSPRTALPGPGAGPPGSRAGHPQPPAVPARGLRRRRGRAGRGARHRPAHPGRLLHGGAHRRPDWFRHRSLVEGLVLCATAARFVGRRPADRIFAQGMLGLSLAASLSPEPPPAPGHDPLRQQPPGRHPVLGAGRPRSWPATTPPPCCGPAPPSGASTPGAGCANIDVPTAVVVTDGRPPGAAGQPAGTGRSHPRGRGVRRGRATMGRASIDPARFVPVLLAGVPAVARRASNAGSQRAVASTAYAGALATEPARRHRAAATTAAGVPAPGLAGGALDRTRHRDRGDHHGRRRRPGR